MIKFLKNIVLFSLILFFCTSLINLFQKKYNPDPEHFRQQYAEITNKENFHEGIIIGASHATHSIRPSILDKSGIKFHNFALNGANPEFYYHWYNRTVSKSKVKPTHCIFAINYFMFDSSWLWRRIEQDSEYLTFSVFWKDFFTEKRFNKKDLIINRFPFLKYRGRIKESLRLKKGDNRYLISEYDRGYISLQIPYEDDNFKPILKHKIDPVQVTFFTSLLKKLQSENIKVIFVMTPEYGIDINEYEKMESLKIISSLSNELKIPIVNFNTELKSSINTNIKFYSDWGHLNTLGSKVFSEKLAKEIKILTNQ